MEFVAKEEVIKTVHRVMAEYLLGERVFYTDKDDIIFDINKAICLEIKKLSRDCNSWDKEYEPLTWHD